MLGHANEYDWGSWIRWGQRKHGFASVSWMALEVIDLI